MWDGIVATGLHACDGVLHEALLFAAIMFFIGGIDDLLVDVAYVFCRRPAGILADVPVARAEPLAIFIGAWDEQAVIGAMLRTALARLDHPDYRIFVGCYPNDPATIAAVEGVCDARVRLVVGNRAGPTTKADCLNTLWRALVRDDIAGGRHTHAVILHDAEDVLHPAELRVIAHHLRDHALVQLPVVPLIDPAAPMVTGHYADEFALAHAVALPVRTAIGAAMPLAGVGCAIRRDALDQLARATGDAPFEPASLTEDYELGLRVAALGYRSCFVRVREHDGGALVAVRAYFPDTVRAAVVQKARWMTGIALAGWDRTGWGGRFRGAELWMRMRDRRAPLAVLTLAFGYVALVAWGVSMLGHRLIGSAAPGTSDLLAALLSVNALLLAWRLLVRAQATAHEHGWREGLRVAGQKSWPFNRQFLLDSTNSAPSMQTPCSAPSAAGHRVKVHSRPLSNDGHAGSLSLTCARPLRARSSSTGCSRSRARRSAVRSRSAAPRERRSTPPPHASPPGH